MSNSSDTYFTIDNKAQGELKEKGSRFISILYPVYSEEEAMDKVKSVRKEYYDATHHCFAYIISKDKSIFRANDDGEPSYSAGKPIYNALLSKDLTNVLCVVVRYFGGTKLGVGGLIKAYRHCAEVAIENSHIIEKKVMLSYKVSFSYQMMNEVMKILKQYSLKPQNNFFEENCSLEFEIRKSLKKEILDKFSLIDGVNLIFLAEK